MRWFTVKMYEFKGFFVPDGTHSLIDEIRVRWPTAIVREVDDVFKGVGARFPELEVWGRGTGPQWESAFRSVTNIRRELVEFSRSHPENTFVIASAECWGGDCDYEGFVCRGGRIISKARRGPASLRPLLDHLGIPDEEQQYFFPFTQHFPWHTSRD